MLKHIFINVLVFLLKLQFTIMLSAPFLAAGFYIWKLFN